MRVFAGGLVVLVGAVFLAARLLIANRIDAPALSGIVFGDFSWLLLIVLGVILVYYIVATLLPVDKIIKRIYPVSAVRCFSWRWNPCGTAFQREIHDSRIHLPEPDRRCMHGFRSCRCPYDHRLRRDFGISRHAVAADWPAVLARASGRPVLRRLDLESIIALIWAAVAMAFWERRRRAERRDCRIRRTGGRDGRRSPATRWARCWPVRDFRSWPARSSGRHGLPFGAAIVADFMGVEQRSLRKRIYISVPLFAAGLVIIFCPPFRRCGAILRTMNQTLAMVTLWMITAF